MTNEDKLREEWNSLQLAFQLRHEDMPFNFVADWWLEKMKAQQQEILENLSGVSEVLKGEPTEDETTKE